MAPKVNSPPTEPLCQMDSVTHRGSSFRTACYFSCLMLLVHCSLLKRGGTLILYLLNSLPYDVYIITLPSENGKWVFTKLARDTLSDYCCYSVSMPRTCLNHLKKMFLQYVICCPEH